mgnify:CR=1 FL=1
MNNKEIRKAAGFTQQSLADACGMQIRQIQRLEAGEVHPGDMAAKNLFAVADALGIDPRALLSDKPS